jgi:hypothetical protein
MVAKQLEYLADALMAGVVLGARVPIVLTSRADTAETRTASCAIAQLMAHKRRQESACESNPHPQRRLVQPQVRPLPDDAAAGRPAAALRPGRRHRRRAADARQGHPHRRALHRSLAVPDGTDQNGQHRNALEFVFDWIRRHSPGVEIVAAGHRIVHGGDHYSGPVVLSPDAVGTSEP